jgi:hypothetical protein
MEVMMMNTKMLNKVVAKAVKVIGKTPFLLPLMNWPMTERDTSIHAKAAAKKKPLESALRDCDSSCFETISRLADTRSVMRVVSGTAGAAGAAGFGRATGISSFAMMAAIV